MEVTETQASRLAAIKALCDAGGGDYYWAPAPTQPEADRLMRDWIREAVQELVAASTGTGYQYHMIGKALGDVSREFWYQKFGGDDHDRAVELMETLWEMGIRPRWWGDK